MELRLKFFAKERIAMFLFRVNARKSLQRDGKALLGSSRRLWHLVDVFIILSNRDICGRFLRKGWGWSFLRNDRCFLSCDKPEPANQLSWISL